MNPRIDSIDIDARPRLAQRGGTMARPVTPTLACWLAVAALFVAAMALRHVVTGNSDVSWLLIVGERVLDGQRLYSDLLETNPPIAVLAYLPGIATARALGLRPELVTDGLVFALAAASLGTTALLLRNARAFGAIKPWPLLAIAAAVLTILPMHSFGQREHIALMIFLPALAAFMLRADREPVPPWAVAVAGLGAAVTMMFKPHFALVVGGSIVVAALRAKSWRTLFAPENFITALAVIVYGVGVFIFYRDYFTLIFPLVRDVYLHLVVSKSALFGGAATTLWMAGAICAIAARRLGGRGEKSDTALLMVLTASFGFAVAFFLQRKGWPYQSYPMIALALLAAAMAIAGSGVNTPLDRRFRLGGLALLAAIFAASCVWFNAHFDERAIEASVAQLKTHPKILMLSSEPGLGNPLTRDLDGVWVSHQQDLWIREYVRLLRQNGAVDPNTDARFDRYLAREREGLIADFHKQPPDIILVDNDASDWGAWARADAELSALMKPYRLVQTIEGIDILRRDD
jgi:hypothetical protein